MEKEHLKAILALIPDGVPYMIEGNSNIELYVGYRDCEVTFFDDNTNTVINIRQNTSNSGARYKFPIMVQALPYDQIQRIVILLDPKTLETYLASTSMTEEEQKKAYSVLAPLFRANINPLEGTNRTLTVDEYNDIQK